MLDQPSGTMTLTESMRMMDLTWLLWPLWLTIKNYGPDDRSCTIARIIGHNIIDNVVNNTTSKVWFSEHHKTE
jgi:hypothetical protein